MIVFSIDQLLEGYINKVTYVKIYPSSFKQCHYVIQENHETSDWSCELVTHKAILLYLEKLKHLKVINEIDILTYLHDIKNRINLTKITKS